MSQLQGPAYPPAVAGTLSPDGYWRWDGLHWVPLWQAPPAVVPYFRSGSTLALWARISIALNLLAMLVVIVADAGRITITSRIINGEAVTLADAQASDNFVRLSAVLQLITLAIAAIAFSMWIHRVTSNGPAMGGAQLRYTPGWAVGWFYVPLANIVMPYRVVTEVWRTSDPHAGLTTAEQRARMKASPLVGAWWLLFVLASGPIRFAFFSARNDTAAALRTAAIADIVGSAGLIIAGLLAVAVIGAIDTRQTQKHLATLTRAPQPS